MRLLAKSIDHIEHPVQGAIEGAACEQIFEALSISEHLQALAVQFLPQMLEIEPDEAAALTLAKQWAARGLCDYICQDSSAGELIFVE